MVKETLLARGETVVFSAHAHWKNLVVPILVTALTVAAATYALVELVPDPQEQGWQRWTILAVAGLLVVAFGIWPFLGWVTSTDVLTTRRLISRRGILSREGKDIPIDRVHSVSYRRSVLDRMLGCGTLVVETAGNDSDVELFDVAHIERRILQIQEIILDEEIPAEGAHATRRGADRMRGAADSTREGSNSTREGSNSTREGSDSTREGQDDADQDAIAGR